MALIKTSPKVAYVFAVLIALISIIIVALAAADAGVSGKVVKDLDSGASISSSSIGAQIGAAVIAGLTLLISCTIIASFCSQRLQTNLNVALLAAMGVAEACLFIYEATNLGVHDVSQQISTCNSFGTVGQVGGYTVNGYGYSAQEVDNAFNDACVAIKLRVSWFAFMIVSPLLIFTFVVADYRSDGKHTDYDSYAPDTSEVSRGMA